MDIEKKDKIRGVIWLKKTGFDFDVLGGATPLNHQFGEGVFSYLEVLNEERLEEDINGFVEQNKIQPCELILVFDKSVVFEKEINVGDDFQRGDVDRANKEIPSDIKNGTEMEENFVDSVPFENVLAKLWLIEGQNRLVVANADCFYSIRNILEKKGFLVVSAIPYCVIGADALSQSVTQVLWKDPGAVVRESITAVEAAPRTTQAKTTLEKAPEAGESRHTKREIYLVVFFFILIIVFGVVVYIQ